MSPRIDRNQAKSYPQYFASVLVEFVWRCNNGFQVLRRDPRLNSIPCECTVCGRHFQQKGFSEMAMSVKILNSGCCMTRCIPRT